MLGLERRSLFASALVATLVAVSPEPARAQAQPLDARGSAIDIVVVGSELDVAALASALGPNEFRGAEARLQRGERLSLRTLLEADTSDARVRCYVDLSNPGRADLYFADRRAERFLVRQVALPAGLDDLGRETLGQVLSLSVLALLDDGASALNREQARTLLAQQAVEPAVEPNATADAPKPAGVPATPPNASVGLEPFYALRVFSSEAPISHGPGLDIGWVSAPNGSFDAAWVGAAYELERRYRSEIAGLTWSTVTLRGTFEHLEHVADDVLLGARAGAGVDWLSFAPALGTGDEDIELRGARVTTSFLIHLGLGARVELGARFQASLRLFADFYPTRARYAVERTDGDAVDVLEPLRVRPGAAFALLLR